MFLKSIVLVIVAAASATSVEGGLKAIVAGMDKSQVSADSGNVEKKKEFQEYLKRNFEREKLDRKKEQIIHKLGILMRMGEDKRRESEKVVHRQKELSEEQLHKQSLRRALEGEEKVMEVLREFENKRMDEFFGQAIKMFLSRESKVL